MHFFALPNSNFATIINLNKDDHGSKNARHVI